VIEGTVALAYDDTAGERIVVRFNGVASALFGAPNDEALQGHPLFGRGLQFYEFAEVENSPWIAELERANRVHPGHSAERYARLRHFIFPFHDSTFECVALAVELVQPHSEDALAAAARVIDPDSTE
jgi:hypothetical protein